MSITKKANLVVIGSGGAGLSAAVTAMQSGVDNIVVLEKSHFMGGNSRMAGGMMFSPESTIKGKSPKEARDEVFRETIEFHHYTRVEPKILRAFLENAQGSIDWLEESGFKGYKHIYPFGNFYKSIKKMISSLEAAGNEVLNDTRVTGILKNADGAVSAVTATSHDGQELVYETKAVMLASGGFTGNSQLLHEYFPDDYDDNFYTDALPQNGDGIDLARDAGASLTKYCTIIKENAYSCDSRLDAPNRGAHNGMSLWVNSFGERFHDESETHADSSTNALVKQPNMLGYALFDQNIIEAEKNAPPFIGGPFGMGDADDAGDDHEDMKMPFGFGMLGKQLEAESKRSDGWCFKADTLDEIAGFIGADPEVLKATVEEYNSYCLSGRDELFAKAPAYLIALTEPPYFALKFRPLLIDTAGPIVVNEKMQVLDDNHKPIKGLYAGGVITSGWQGVDYHLFGSALCYSVTSGRIAGRSIIEQLK